MTERSGSNHPFLGVALLVLPFILFVLLIEVWPSTGAPAGPEVADQKATIAVLETRRDNAKGAFGEDEANTAKKAAFIAAERELATAENELEKRSMAPGLVFGTRIYSNEVRLLLIVLLSGAIGSSIHAANAYGYYHGVRKYKGSWYWWYLLRFPIGMGLALLIYLVLRGGLFAGSFANGEAATDLVNPFGFAALAALAGMFSKQATAKLEEIFDGIFRTDDEHAPKGDDGANPPVLSSASVVHAGAAGDDLKVTLTGKNFAEGAKVTVNGEERDFERVSDIELIVTLLDSDVAKAGKELEIVVRNPPDKGGNSEIFRVKVVEPE